MVYLNGWKPDVFNIRDRETFPFLFNESLIKARAFFYSKVILNGLRKIRKKRNSDRCRSHCNYFEVEGYLNEEALQRLKANRDEFLKEIDNRVCL